MALLSRGCRALQPLDVTHGRLAKRLLVHPAEVRPIVVAHAVSGGRGIGIAGEEESPGLLQAELPLELQRAHRGDGLEVMVEARDAHPDLPGEAGHVDRLVVVLANAFDRPCDPMPAALGDGDQAK